MNKPTFNDIFGMASCDGCRHPWFGKYYDPKDRFCNQCQAVLDTHDHKDESCPCYELVGTYADDFRAKQEDFVK